MRIPLYKPYIGDIKQICKEIEHVCTTGFLIQGIKVNQFEEQVASFLEVKHAIAVNSGTSALHLALCALDIGPGDEVIVPAYTFYATANVIEAVGATPLFVDVSLDTYNIDPEDIKKKITPHTKAIMPVHLFGNPAAMDAIMHIAQEYNLSVIEDAAGAFGAAYKGKKVGTIGNVGCFSFHPRKTITTGEGGMIVTNDDTIADFVRSKRNHGKDVHGDDVHQFGFNFRMNEIQAVLGIAQMNIITNIIQKRQELAKHYETLLKKCLGVATQRTEEGGQPILQAFVIKLKQKQNTPVIEALREKGIDTVIGTYAVPLLSFYKQKYKTTCPHAETLFQTSIAIPFFHELSVEDMKQVCQALQEVA